MLLHTKIGLLAAYETCEFPLFFKAKLAVRIWYIKHQGKGASNVRKSREESIISRRERQWIFKIMEGIRHS